MFRTTLYGDLSWFVANQIPVFWIFLCMASLICRASCRSDAKVFSSIPCDCLITADQNLENVRRDDKSGFYYLCFKYRIVKFWCPSYTVENKNQVFGFTPSFLIFCLIPLDLFHCPVAKLASNLLLRCLQNPASIRGFCLFRELCCRPSNQGYLIQQVEYMCRHFHLICQIVYDFYR